MNRDAELLNQIYEVTRGELETTRFPFPQLGPIVDNTTCVRISRLSRFWKQGESEDLTQSTEDLVAGLYGQSCPWVFLLKGTPQTIECWFGASRTTVDRATLRSSLSGAFPDIRFKDSPALDKTGFNHFKHALVLTGTPSPKTDTKQETIGDGIEKVCRGLYGSDWFYAVYAEPVPTAEISRYLNEIAKRIRDVHATYLLKASPTDEQNRIAQRYVELLEAKLKRWEQGSEVVANPKGRAIEVFANILSEIRAYGEGILIAEQIPVKLTPGAIKNTNLKVVHRLVAEDDREAVGNTMNLSESQMRYLTTLRAGEGVAYTEGMQKPVLLTVPLSQTKSAYQEVSTEEVREAMRSFWLSNSDLLLPFPGCTKCPVAGDNGNCGIRGSSRVDVLLLESFRRLFNTLWLNKPLVLDAYSDFNLLCQRNPVRGKGKNSTYCLFVELVDSEVERRGEFSGWSYEDVERAIELACSVMSSITRNFGQAERKKLEKEFSKDLTPAS